MALDKNKTDPELGLKIRKYLTSIGVETPTRQRFCIKSVSGTPNVQHIVEAGSEQIHEIEILFHDIMNILGLNLTDDSLKNTPARVADMFVNELFWGLNTENFPKCTVVENIMCYDEMVVEKNITVNSTCEHHFVSIDGYATIAYIPKTKIIGLSKLNRITEYFSRRPQIQERLTAQIFHALVYILDTDNVAVTINATHHCVGARGIQDQNSKTITSKLGGLFKSDAKARSEFMNIATDKE